MKVNESLCRRIRRAAEPRNLRLHNLSFSTAPDLAPLIVLGKVTDRFTLAEGVEVHVVLRRHNWFGLVWSAFLIRDGYLVGNKSDFGSRRLARIGVQADGPSWI